MMASATSSRVPWASPSTSAGIAARTLSMGSCTPMTPVEDTCTASSGMPSPSATWREVSRAERIPCSPVQALAFPLLTTKACDRPLLMRSADSSTGAALTALVVKTATAVAGVSEKIRARSFLPCFFMAASTAAN